MTGKISDSPSLPTRLGRRPAKDLLSCTVRLRLMVSLPLEGFPRPLLSTIVGLSFSRNVTIV